jgi:hypothetical protein
VDRKRREALRARQDDIADRLNEYGPGQPDDIAGAAKRRPRRPQGNSRACILRRLRRDYPQLHQLVLDGVLSPHRAAIAAGFRKVPGPKPKRRPADPLELSPDQAQELWLGAGANGSVFQDESERHAAWLKHRDRLMELWGAHGRRQLAWWCYEAPADLDYDYSCEQSTLYEAGLLSETEMAELTVRWKYEFDRACRRFKEKKLAKRTIGGPTFRLRWSSSGRRSAGSRAKKSPPTRSLKGSSPPKPQPMEETEIYGAVRPAAQGSSHAYPLFGRPAH